jgi:integrase
VTARLEKPQENRFQVLFITVALTGLRLGELLALQWKHVDFENCKLRIQQSLWNAEIVPVKTRSSVRVILFGDVLARHLTDHLQRSVHTDYIHVDAQAPDQ